MAAADQLNEAGFKVTVYERNDKPGGLLRYGIPDFKLEKPIVDRRIDVMEQQGITFIAKVNVGLDIEVAEINKHFDAVLLCGGSTVPRDLTIPGRDAKGIYFAMQFLEQSNKHVDFGLNLLPLHAQRHHLVPHLGQRRSHMDKLTGKVLVQEQDAHGDRGRLKRPAGVFGMCQGGLEGS